MADQCGQCWALRTRRNSVVMNERRIREVRVLSCRWMSRKGRLEGKTKKKRKKRNEVPENLIAVASGAVTTFRFVVFPTKPTNTNAHFRPFFHSHVLVL